LRVPGRLAWLALAIGATPAILLTACGNDNSSTEQTAAEQQTVAEQQSSAGAPKPLPPNAPISAVLARQFPKPKPQPNAPVGSQAAIDAGRKACKGKTPIQVREEFISEAKASGLLNPGQTKMISEIAHFEKQAAHSPDFAAGQLAAGVYQATLPEQLRIAGYQGCVYELAQQLEKEIRKG
jgi:hypothetical protein